MSVELEDAIVRCHPQVLRVFRDVQLRQPAVELSWDSPGSLNDKLRKLLAYWRLDGAVLAARKALTRVRGIGQWGQYSFVSFSASEATYPDGIVHVGEWSGIAIGHLSTFEETSDLTSWRYALEVDRSTGFLSTGAIASDAWTSGPTPRVGIVGAGAFVNNVVVPALSNGGATVTAVSDASTARARQVARRFGIGTVLPSPQDLIDCVHDLDGLVIAAAHSSHSTLLMEAMEARTPVLVEKPVALSAEDLDALLVHPDRPPIWVGHNRRHSRFFDVLYRAASREPFALLVEVEGFPLDEFHWYRAPGQGGRVLGNLTHWLDLGVALGGPPDSFEWSQICGSGYRVNMCFSGGSEATINLYDVGRRIVPGRERLVLRTQSVTITIDDWAALHTEDRNRNFSKSRRRDRGHQRLYSTWTAALRNGSVADRLQEAVPSHRIAMAIMASNR